MKKPYLFCVVSLLVFLTAPAGARVLPLDVQVNGDSSQAALTLATRYAADLGAPGARLLVRRVVQVPDGQAVHMEQVHDGLQVLGGNVTALLLGGRAVALTGKLVPLTLGAAVVDRGALMTLAQARVAVEAAQARSTVRSGRLALLPPLLASSAGEARPVWVLDMITAQPLGLFEVLADARTGQVLRKRSTMRDAQGKIYSTNPKVGTLKTDTLQGLVSGKKTLTGEYAAVKSCSYVSQKANCTQYAKPDSKGDYIFTPDEGKFDDPFAEVMAYYHVDTFHRYMKKSFGFARQGKTGIEVFVNLHSVQGGQKRGMANAFYGDLNGDSIGDLVFGQGSKDFAYDADVIYHEFTHSAVDETSNLTVAMDSLGFNATPAALNEGFADIFSSFHAGDPVVGDYMKSTGIRNISGNAVCPDFLNGESHNDGMLWGRAVWTFRKTLQDTKTYDAAVYTVMAGLSKNAGFDDAAKLLDTTLKAKDATLAASLAAEMKKRGVDTCTRVIPLKPAQVRSFYAYGLSIAPSLKAVPGPFQYKIAVPAKATSMTIYVQKVYGYGGGMGAYIRVGKTVAYDYYGPIYDHVKDSNSAAITLSTSDTTGKLKLVPGSTYYVLPMSTSNYTSGGSVSVVISEEPIVKPDTMPHLPDAGATPLLDIAPVTDSLSLPNPGVNPDTPDRGCSCEVQGTTDGAGLATLLLIGLLVVRRRKRA